jgi:tripartite-type tricarboxylate transporter receptor subunit TctC
VTTVSAARPSPNQRAHRLLIAALVAFCPSPALAQTGYPEKPIRLVVPFPPGASNDIIARAVGQKLNEAVRQPVVIDNRGGAGGSIGAAIVARAPADGYTLMATSTSYSTNSAVQSGLPFDPVADITPVAMIGRGPMMVVVSPSVQAQSIRDLVALAKSKPGQVNYTSSGVGSAPHLTTELFMRQAGIDMVHIPYKGLGPAFADMFAGRAQVLIASLPSVLAHVKTNRLRALAVTSPQRSAFVPGLATVSESGISFTSELWWGVFAPARTPAAVVGRLNGEIRKFVASDDMKRLLADAGAEPAALSSAEFASLVATEIAMWRRVAKERNIKAE